MSTTVLAEYMDMIFTRAHTELGERNWWLEMRPPTTHTDPRGYVCLVAKVRGPAPEHKTVVVEHRAKMKAVEENARVSIEVLEIVVENHLKLFESAIKEAERTGESFG